jgi:hypothetical protein
VTTFLGEANWPGTATSLGRKADTRLLSPVSLALSSDSNTLWIGQTDGGSFAMVVKYDMTINYTSVFVGNGVRVGEGLGWGTQAPQPVLCIVDM